MILRELIERKLKKENISQRKFADIIGVSNGTISNILSGHIPRSTKILDKFAEYFNVSIDSLRLNDGNFHVKETVSPYHLSPKLERLVGLAEHLDKDELATLERCAEAFRAEEPEVRQHLIGQLKIIERLVNPEHAPTAKEKKRHGSPS